MKIEHLHNNIKYILSNEDVKIDDEVFPISSGYIIEKKYIHQEFDFRHFMCGFPDCPHYVKKIIFSDNNPNIIYTDKGYAFKERYYKIIAIKTKHDKLIDIINTDTDPDILSELYYNKPKKLYLCALCDGVPCHKDCEDCNK